MELLIALLMFLTVMTASGTHAAPLEPQAVLKTYKAGGKSCKQIEQDHERMRGQHELMFTAWKEKSLPLLTEDKELLTSCNDALLALQEIVEKQENRDDSSPSPEVLTADYEKTRNLIGTTITRHKILREKHERIFHEMMGH